MYSGLGDIVRSGAVQTPDKPAIIYQDGTVLTYTEFDRRTNRVANMLAAAGLKRGERLALLARNSPFFLEVVFGAAKLGIACAMLNWRLSPPELTYIFEDCDPAALVIDHALIGAIDSGALPIIELEGPAGPAAYETRLAAVSDADPGVPVSRDDVAFLIYTSGTTGKPKGAVTTHGNLAHNIGLDSPELPRWVQMRSDDVQLVSHPLFHIGAMEQVLRALGTGATMVLHRDFDTAMVVADIVRHGITIIGLVPTAINMLLREPSLEQAEISTLRRVTYGASPMPRDLLLETAARFGCDMVQFYGMTETSGTFAMLGPDEHIDPANPRLRSAGSAIFGAGMRIVGPDGTVLGPHEAGEISIHFSGVIAGYWQRPDATAEAIGADGWLRTGDAGVIDADGFVYIRDRIKDMIITGGENVYPAEVESAIFGHPSVAEVAVVGVPHPRWTEAVKAVVVAKPGHDIDPDEIIAFARTRIAGFKLPRSVDVVAELPKNASGKILRRTIRAGYWEGHESAATLLTDPQGA
ncbi:MAG: long-chain-fatty-acid--CoA ligase [Pseudomonadota bacterium]